MSEKLSELVKRGESEEVEFKKSTAQLDRALKSVCSFLNHKGGRVYFGISKGKIDGQDVSEQTLKSISQKIRQRIKPEICLEIKVLEIEEKKIIEVIISEGDNKPYYLDGIAYKRVGTENVVVPPEELERIILEKRKRYFDSEICERAGLEDIDEEKVKWFLKVAKVGRDYPLDENISVRDALTHLELLKEGKLTNVAVVLFGKNPQKFFLQSEVKCLHFHGTEVEKPFDRIEIWNPGELPKQLKIEDLRKPHPSLPRNHIIANLLYLTKYILNKEYCNLLKVSRKTATTDLIDLVDKGIFSPFGTSKRVLRYEFKLRKNYAKRR